MDSGGDIKVHVATILQLYYSFTFFYDNLMTQVSIRLNKANKRLHGLFLLHLIQIISQCTLPASLFHTEF